MSRNLLLASLLLTMGVVLAEDVPETGPAPGAPGPQAQKEAEKDARKGEAAKGMLPAGEEPEAEGIPDAPEAQPRKEAEKDARKQNGPKEISGMSILGNREAPKSLVIVPWKSSEIGNSLGISPMLDDSRQPVDKEVFLRALRYYEIQHAGHGAAAGVDEGTP